MLFLAAVLALVAAAQKRKDASAWTIYGNVINDMTRRNVMDTIKVSLISSEGVVVKSTSAKPEQGEKNDFRINVGEDGMGKYTLRLEHPDYSTANFPVELTKRIRMVNVGALPIHKLTLSEKRHLLGEVTVTATKIKFYHKGDTIVYNADAFNLAQGSMLDGLIEQLPGVELDSNGVIKVNGKPVESLLLNGKEFFKGKNSVLLENMPAYMVKDVKVYEGQTEEDKLLGIRGNEILTMNVSLKKEFSKGVIANAELGIGTHLRYAARAFGLLYSDHFRLSAYGTINNTNDGRKPGRDGNWRGSSGNSGREIIRQAGFDYQVYGKENKYELVGTLNAGVNDNNRTTTTYIQNFLPEGDTYTARFNNNFNRYLNISTYHAIKLRPNPSKYDNISFSVNGSYNNNRTSGSIIEATFNQNPEAESLRDDLITGGQLANSAVNRMLQKSRQRAHSLNGYLYSHGTFTIAGRDDFFGYDAQVGGNSSVKNAPDTYQLFYGTQPQSLRDRLNLNDTKGVSATGSIYYCFRPNGQMQINAEYNTIYNNNNGVNDWYNSNRTAQTQSEAEEIARQLDIENSYHSRNYHLDHKPQLKFFYQYDREADGNNDGYVRLDAALGSNFRHSVLDYRGITDFRLSKDFILPDFNTTLAFTTHRRAHYLDVKYYFNVTDPTIMNLADVVFTNDPLNIRQGNPNLKNSSRHFFQSNYRADGLYRKGIWISAQVEYAITNMAHAMSTIYDRATGVRITKPINIDGNWNTHARSDMTFPLTRDRNLNLGTTIYYGYSESADMSSENGMESTVKTLIYNHNTWDILSLEYKFRRHRVKAKGEMNYNHIEGSQAGFGHLNIWSYSYGLTGMFTLPLDFQISTDFFVHSKRGYSDPNANYNSMVWNAGVSKPLLKGALIVKLDAFDILRQIRNTHVTINAQGRTETTFNTLPAYLMVRVVYNFSKQPRK